VDPQTLQLIAEQKKKQKKFHRALNSSKQSIVGLGDINLAVNGYFKFKN